MSPLTAMLKCPHYEKGNIRHESEGEAEVYVLNRTDFLSFLQKNEGAIKCVLSCLSGRLRKTDDLLEDASFLTVSARLAKKLIELGREFGVKDKEVVRIGLRLRPLKNATFFCQARKAKILTGGIHYVFRGLKFEA